MPLSSPTKPTSKAAHTAKQQAQIVSLTAQRDELLQQYKAALQSQSSPKSITKPSAFVALDVPPASTTTASTVPDTAATSGQDTPPALVQGGMTREETEELMKHATGTLKRHIRLLHEYNEIKDVATGLVGLVAEQRGEKVGVVMEEMGVGTALGKVTEVFGWADLTRVKKRGRGARNDYTNGRDEKGRYEAKVA